MIRTESVQREGRSIALVLLDRPEKRNALTPEMMADLCAALETAPRSHDAIVLAGQGKVFCAGFDLALCKADPSGGVMRALLMGLSRACVIMRRTEKPVVIAAHGGAIAGGCALLGGGDVVVCDVHAKLGYPVTKIGVSPAVSAPFLSNNVTRGAAREMLLLPELMSGADGFVKGLVHELVTQDFNVNKAHSLVLESAEDMPAKVREVSLDIAAQLANKPSHAIASTKDWLAHLEGSGQRAMIEEALNASLSLTGGPEERRLLGSLQL